MSDVVDTVDEALWADAVAAPAPTDADAAAPAPTDAATAAPAPLDRNSVLRQLEYYFSDVAYPYDDFLQGEADESGGILAATLANSPRLVSMTKELSLEERTSLLLDLVAGSDDVKKVGEDRLARAWPLPLTDPKAPRSVYLSGCPKDADPEQLIAMLNSGPSSASFLPIVSVRRIRDVQRDRSYSGQLHVECEDEAKAAALCKAAMRGASGVLVNKAKLLSDFFAKQHATVIEQKEKRAAKQAAGSGTKRAAPDAPSAEEQAAAAAANAEKRKTEAAEYRQLVIRFEGAGETADRECCEELCKAFETQECKMQYVDFQRGETAGQMRFNSAAGAATALATLSAGGADLGGAVPTWRVMTEEEGEAYYEAYIYI